MSRQPFRVSSPEQRDQAAEDRDETAWQRDLASAARDRAADDRDAAARARIDAATQWADSARHLLDFGGSEGPRAESLGVVRGLLARLDQALHEADMATQAAIGDRQAAAADRRQAAEDRIIKAAHREQAAIERAQHAPPPALVDHGRWNELHAQAQSARTRAETLCQRAGGFLAAPPDRVLLRHSELARLRARLETMPVIEQAKGIIMAQTGCGHTQAFEHLRQASQRMNKPVRDLAVRIVASPAAKRNPAARQAGTPVTASPGS